jgi:hypothetical protein
VVLLTSKQVDILASTGSCSFPNTGACSKCVTLSHAHPAAQIICGKKKKEGKKEKKIMFVFADSNT